MEILYFYADWCKPCKALKPTLKDLKENNNIQIVELNVETNDDLVDEYSISSVPTLIIKHPLGDKRLTGTCTKAKILEEIK